MAGGAEDAHAHSQDALLAVSGVINNHMSPRPHLPLDGQLTGPNLDDIRSTGVAATVGPEALDVHAVAAPTAPLPALTLDPLTAVDNPAYYQTLAQEQNIPPHLRSAIAGGQGAGHRLLAENHGAVPQRLMEKVEPAMTHPYCPGYARPPFDALAWIFHRCGGVGPLVGDLVF